MTATSKPPGEESEDEEMGDDVVPPQRSPGDMLDIRDEGLRANVLATAKMLKALQYKTTTTKAGKARAATRRFATQGDSSDEDPEELTVSRDESDFRSLVCGRFSRGYADEGHFIKNRRTATSMSIRMAGLSFVLVSSATPAPTRVTDYLTYLDMICPVGSSGDASWQRHNRTPETLVDWYKDPDVAANLKLGSAPFKYLCEHNDMSLRHAYQVLPFILGNIQLKRSIGEHMDIGTAKRPYPITIGADIPPYRIFHLLTEPRPIERLDVGQTYASLAPQLISPLPDRKDSSAPTVDNAHLNLHTIRRLMQNSFCSSLERVTRDYGKEVNVAGILETVHSADHGKLSNRSPRDALFLGRPKKPCFLADLFQVPSSSFEAFAMTPRS